MRLRRNLHVSGAALDRIAVGRFHCVVAFVRGQLPGSRTDLDLLLSGRLFDFSRRITLGGRIHDVDPDRQRQLPPERAAINFLRLIETGPHGAREIGIVSRKERVREIVRGSGFSGCREFL